MPELRRFKLKKHKISRKHALYPHKMNFRKNTKKQNSKKNEQKNRIKKRHNVQCFLLQKSEIHSIFVFGVSIRNFEVSDENNFHLWVSKLSVFLDYMKNYERYEDEPKT